MIGNWFKTALLMAGIVALFGAIGGVIGGERGMLIALALGAAMNFFAYWFSDTMVLRMYNAQEVDEASAPQFYRIVQELAARAASASGRVDVANCGTVATQTIWIATYSSATVASPITIAKGVSRRGSRNSPAATTAFSQPTSAKASNSTPLEKS